MSKNKTFRLLVAVLGGPAAGAFGAWLLTSYPAVHKAVCTGGF